jgi:RNA polymerase sigma-70 factor, ECF subfamily
MTPPFIEAIRQFYEDHRQDLFTYALSHTGCAETAEDAMHTAFYRVLKRRRPPRELRPYIFRCVRNAAIDALRAGQRSPNGESMFDLPTTPSPEEDVHRRHLAEQMLEKLSDDERECVVLKVYSGMSFREIAAVKNVPQGTAASWYRRGIAKLRARFEEETP